MKKTLWIITVVLAALAGAAATVYSTIYSEDDAVVADSVVANVDTLAVAAVDSIPADSVVLTVDSLTVDSVK